MSSWTFHFGGYGWALVGGPLCTLWKSSMHLVHLSGPHWLWASRDRWYAPGTNAQWFKTWFLVVEVYTQFSSSSSNPLLQMTLCAAQAGMPGCELTWPHRCAILKVSSGLSDLVPPSLVKIYSLSLIVWFPHHFLTIKLFTVFSWCGFYSPGSLTFLSIVGTLFQVSLCLTRLGLKAHTFFPAPIFPSLKFLLHTNATSKCASSLLRNCQWLLHCIWY